MPDRTICPGCGAEFDSDHAMWIHAASCEALAAKRNEAFRQALSKPRYLSKSEAIEFLERKKWMGVPKRLPRGRRGPQTRRTQYDEAADRSRELLRRLKKLPAQAAHAGKARAQQLAAQKQRTESEMLSAAKLFTPYRQRVAGKARNFADLVRKVSEKIGHDRKTVRTILKSAGY